MSKYRYNPTQWLLDSEDAKVVTPERRARIKIDLFRKFGVMCGELLIV